MISPRQLEERELRRKRILEGALEVFHKKGLEGATMDEIANEAGFGKATLYYYFTSKEEVFCAIMEKGWKPKHYTDKGSIIVSEEILEKINMEFALKILSSKLFYLAHKKKLNILRVLFKKFRL